MDRSKISNGTIQLMGDLALLWGLVGASTIAAEHMIGAMRGQGGQIGWVVSGKAEHAKAYAQTHGIAKSTTDLGEMLADPQIEPSTSRPPTKSTTPRRWRRLRRASMCCAKSRWR
jgi:hypothetical protein